MPTEKKEMSEKEKKRRKEAATIEREINRLHRLVKKFDKQIEERITEEPYSSLEFGSDMGLTRKLTNDPLKDLMAARKEYESKIQKLKQQLRRVNKTDSGKIMVSF